MQKKYLLPLLRNALNKLKVSKEFYISFDIPNNSEHGDLSTNIAMILAKELKKAPRTIAQEIISLIEIDSNVLSSVEIAGSGFINFKFNNNFYADCLETIDLQGINFDIRNIGNGTKVNIEYVSCNPTGLLHLGHGRNAAVGDTLANLYEYLGFNVTREYYFNNAGNQMNILAKSIHARYRQTLVDSNFPFPEDGYHGEYIKDIANEIIEKKGNAYTEGNKDDLNTFREYGEQWCFREIKKTLLRLNINQDIFFNESSLYDDGKIEQLIKDLKDKSIAYEKDGALWLALKQLGMNDDRVIVKSSGEPTYRLPDIAYHREKFERGFDIIIDVFGSDHIATYPDVIAGVKALGYDSEKIKVIIYQFVTLTENGVQVKMSKRTGKSYTLDNLLDEVGADVTRYFFLMRGVKTHLEFDLALAREQSDKNPVFYLQYAHARICSVFRNALAKDIELQNNVEYRLLQQIPEINLIKIILRFPEVIKYSGLNCELQILPEYLHDLAGAFHVFYHNCRIIGVETELSQARLKLAEITKTTLNNGLAILGISAPERM